MKLNETGESVVKGFRYKYAEFGGSVTKGSRIQSYSAELTTIYVSIRACSCSFTAPRPLLPRSCFIDPFNIITFTRPRLASAAKRTKVPTRARPLPSPSTQSQWGGVMGSHKQKSIIMRLIMNGHHETRSQNRRLNAQRNITTAWKRTTMRQR